MRLKQGVLAHNSRQLHRCRSLGESCFSLNIQGAPQESGKSTVVLEGITHYLPIGRMMTYLLNRNLIAAASLSLCFVACADDPEELPVKENAQNTVTAMGDARDVLSMRAESHTADVMAQDQLRNIAIDELRFHSDSLAGLNEMQWHLETLAACLDEAKAPMDRSDASLALAELRAEMRAHQVSMLTMVDPDTARVAEQIFHDRQLPLLEELDAHVDAFFVNAAKYQCTF